jgi:hypothetical protein
MFMIGLFLELRLPKKDLALVGRVLAIKYGAGLLLVASARIPAATLLITPNVGIGPTETRHKTILIIAGNGNSIKILDQFAVNDEFVDIPINRKFGGFYVNWFSCKYEGQIFYL